LTSPVITASAVRTTQLHDLIRWRKHDWWKSQYIASQLLHRSCHWGIVSWWRVLLRL